MLQISRTQSQPGFPDAGQMGCAAEMAIPAAAGQASEIYISICFLAAQYAGRFTLNSHLGPPFTLL